jgi:hypothetical protein
MPTLILNSSANNYIPCARAEILAAKMRTTEEKAIRSIIKAKGSRNTYSQIKSLLGKQQFPLTQVDILSHRNDSYSPFMTLTTRTDIEEQILSRNQRHSKQSLNTPFFTNSILCEVIDPISETSHFDDLINGIFVESITNDSTLSHTQCK